MTHQKDRDALANDAANAQMTIDGGTYTGSTDDELDAVGIWAGELIIKDGTFSAQLGFGVGVWGGTATIEGGTYPDSRYYSAVQVGSNGTLNIKGGDFTVADITKPYTSLYAYGTTTISGGNFYGEIMDDGSHLTIQGGNFMAGSKLNLYGKEPAITAGNFDGCTIIGRPSSAAARVINGGTFTNLKHLEGVCVPDGSTASFTFDDATVSNIFLADGIYDGTIEKISYMKPGDITGGRVSDSLTEKLTRGLTVGKIFSTPESDGYCNIIDSAVVTLKVNVDPNVVITPMVGNPDNAYQNVRVGLSGSSNPSYIRSQSWEFSAGNKIVLQVSNVRTDETYSFKGFLDENENPVAGYTEEISETKKTYISEPFVIDKDMTITAKFAVPNEVNEAQAKEWYEKYSAGTTWQITSEEDMLCFAYCSNILEKDFSNCIVELTKNLNFDGYSYVPVGDSDAHAFKGTFNGNGHTLKNITVKAIRGITHVGVFGKISGAVINDLKVEKISVESDSGDNPSAGGIVGTVAGSSTLNRCEVSGTYISAHFGGGLVGWAGTVTINDCKVSGVKVVGGYTADGAGLVGMSYGTNISGTTVTGVDAESAFIGHGYGTVAIADVTVSDNTSKNVIGIQSDGTCTFEGGSISINNDNGALIGNNTGKLTVKEGTYNVDISESLAADSAVKMGEEGTVLSKDKAIIATEGTYKSGVSDKGTFDQMDIFQENLNALSSGKATYTLTATDSTGTTKTATKEVDYGTECYGDGNIKFGLIVAGIPDGTTVNVELQ